MLLKSSIGRQHRSIDSVLFRSSFPLLPPFFDSSSPTWERAEGPPCNRSSFQKIYRVSNYLIKLPQFLESGTNRHEPICCRAAALSVADVAPVYLKWPSIGSRAAHCLFSASVAEQPIVFSQLRQHEKKVRRNSIFLTLRRSLRRGTQGDFLWSIRVFDYTSPGTRRRLREVLNIKRFALWGVLGFVRFQLWASSWSGFPRIRSWIW